ncbi:MAG: tetratricopeptide repeat protein, partial [Candidatus Poribacteria bacterium]
MSKYTLSKIFFISLFLCFVFYSVNVLSQEALILTKSGEKINCIIQDVEITIKTEAGVKKLAISDIALIDFVSNAKQVSAKAYLHLLRGKQLIKDGFDDMALAEFKIAVDTSPDYVDANFEMGKLLGKMGRKNEAMGYLGRVLTLEPDRLGIDVELKDIGDWYLNKKDFKSAADIYYSLFQKYPQNKNAEFAVYKAGFLYAWELNDSKKAIPALEGAVAKFPDNENVEKALYEIGRLYSDESNLESAEKYFTQLITKFPSGERTDNAHFSLAKVYQQKREYLKAIDEIHKVIDESSDQALIISAQKLIDEFMWDIYSVSDGLPSDNIKALALDKNRVWIGTASGVAQFDIKSSSFIGSIILPNTDITALAVDETYLWIGTADSLVKQYDKVKGDMVQNPLIKSQGSINKILSLSVDKDS